MPMPLRRATNDLASGVERVVVRDDSQRHAKGLAHGHVKIAGGGDRATAQLRSDACHSPDGVDGCAGITPGETDGRAAVDSVEDREVLQPLFQGVGYSADNLDPLGKRDRGPIRSGRCRQIDCPGGILGSGIGDPRYLDLGPRVDRRKRTLVGSRDELTPDQKPPTGVQQLTCPSKDCLVVAGPDPAREPRAVVNH